MMQGNPAEPQDEADQKDYFIRHWESIQIHPCPLRLSGQFNT